MSKNRPGRHDKAWPACPGIENDQLLSVHVNLLLLLELVWPDGEFGSMIEGSHSLIYGKGLALTPTWPGGLDTYLVALPVMECVRLTVEVPDVATAYLSTCQFVIPSIWLCDMCMLVWLHMLCFLNAICCCGLFVMINCNILFILGLWD